MPSRRFAAHLAWSSPERGFVSRRALALLLVSFALAAGSRSIARAEDRLAVIQPGFPGSTEDAAPILSRLASVLAPRAGVKALQAVYHNVPEEALADLRAKGATFGIVSVGFYLEHRKRFGLVPLLELLPAGGYRVLVPPGVQGGVESLRDAPVVGGVLYDLEFVRRIAFAHVAGVAEWKTTPTVQVTRALRHLERGRYRAIVVHDREYTTLAELGRLEKYRELARSEEYPVGVLVAFGAPRGEAHGETEAKTSAEETGASGDEKAPSGEGPSDETVHGFTRAFLGLTEDEEGRKILETLGCDGARRLDRDRWKELERKYDAEKRTEEKK
ncbi:MAG TPA: hypothetical protein VK116_18655 [Planctomycetota bacterium]|nr:hypothetical protein [Planctomycetota bacterium]